ncbi:MAG: hypothetical protein PHQ27_07380, partial [Victivallales bacterium]|nr:hypothetical protein [Victivallales bacterium]
MAEYQFKRGTAMILGYGGLSLAQAVPAAEPEGVVGRMGQWLSSSSAENIYLMIAVLGTTVFVIQFIMQLMGGDAVCDGSADSIESMEVNDAEAVGEINFFSLRSITGFLMFFGWAGFFWGNKGWSGLLIALCCGLFMMIMIAMIIYLMLKLQHSGNINPEYVVNQHGTVYLTIPG